MSERNRFSTDLEFLPSRQYTTESNRTYVGVDESINKQEIHALLKKLHQRGLVNDYGPLWDRERQTVDGRRQWLFSLNESNLVKAMKKSYPHYEIGKPTKHYRYTDAQAVTLLVYHLEFFDRVILLSENTKLDRNGLRKLLELEVKPLLSASNGKLALIALFRKGRKNASMSDYCTRVEKFIQDNQFANGYTEVLV